MNSEFQNPPPAQAEARAVSAESASTELDSARKELAAQKDVNLRLAADFENFKRRSRQESEAGAVAKRKRASWIFCALSKTSSSAPPTSLWLLAPNGILCSFGDVVLP